MRPQLFAEANGSGVTLLICAGSSTAITVDVETASMLRHALEVAIVRARKFSAIADDAIEAIARLNKKEGTS